MDENLIARKVERLNHSLDSAHAEYLLEHCLQIEFLEKIALVSSFGTEAAILLHIISKIKPDLDIIFINTGKLFTLTLKYRDQLVEQFGLTNVIEIRPDDGEILKLDPSGELWSINSDKCCEIRKVRPNEIALSDYDAIITGRKRYHGGSRINLKKFEYQDGKFKINPLAFWERIQINSYFDKYEIPRHPLLARGFLSVGCHHCSEPNFDANNPRAGRWKGKDKTECGIHLSK